MPTARSRTCFPSGARRSSLTTWECRDGRLSLRRRGAQWTEAAAARASVYSAMVLGLRDYVRKNGFRGVVLGLSGGIDSALTAAVAVDALGADRVRGVRLPSRFTSSASHGRRRGVGVRAGHAARHDRHRAARHGGRRDAGRRSSPAGRAT